MGSSDKQSGKSNHPVTVLPDQIENFAVDFAAVSLQCFIA